MPLLFPGGLPKSILDVGCGTGTWLRAASKLGVQDLFGIDGVGFSEEQFLISLKNFKKCDLNTLIDLNRRFDAVFCFEVAEHLEPEFGPTLI